MQTQDPRARTRGNVNNNININICSAPKGRNNNKPDNRLDINNRPGALPNYLGERNIDELKAQCIALFAEVALEKDRARRFELMMKRDLLRLEIMRLESRWVIVKTMRFGTSEDTQDNRRTRLSAKNHVRDRREEDPFRSWYCRSLASDNSYGSSIDINELAKACYYSAKEHRLMASDVLSVACEAWMTGEGYAELKPKTRINRAVSKAVHDIYRQDYKEHNSRERAKLKPGESFRKWTPLVDEPLIELVFGR